ncbi:MAG TPA: nuclear transport factor 2 family protein [Anaeromyxobacter sp.]|nr:nuclear transport factor 2 family protein [Anaeromyxobacter sp.]
MRPTAALLLAAASVTGAPLPDQRTLRDADLALSAAVEAHDRGAFGALVDAEAWFGGGGEALQGRAAVVEGWSDLLQEDGPRLSWTPELSEISRSGDLGYTIGRYRLQRRTTDGREAAQEGRYLTVWRRGADGRFRAAIDVALLPPGALLERAARTPERTLSAAAGDLVAEAGRFRALEGRARGGLYVTVRRRTGDGTLATAVESALVAPTTGSE